MVKTGLIKKYEKRVTVLGSSFLIADPSEVLG
jgi:hypothetical protein